MHAGTTLALVVANNHAYAVTPKVLLRHVPNGDTDADEAPAAKMPLLRDPRLITSKVRGPKEETVDPSGHVGELPVRILPVVYSYDDWKHTGISTWTRQ